MFLNRYKVCVIATSFTLFIALVITLYCNSNIDSSDDQVKISPTTNFNPPSPTSDSSSERVVGVWVPYLDLKVVSKSDTEKVFKEKFKKIIEKSKEFKVNHIFVHVRSHCDALYPSKIFPWSHLLTGTQGDDPNFNPLEFMIETAHANNIKFHAWVNPLRIKSNNIPANLCDKNPFFKFDANKHFLYHQEGVYLNPAFEEIQDLISEGVKEIVSNYKVDGIHFDDRFYPELKSMTSNDIAYEDFLKNTQDNKDKLDIIGWRQNNITNLIGRINKEVKSLNKDVALGISPMGNIEECAIAGIDIPKLCNKSAPLLDYICPQIYWSLDYKVMPFEKTACSWKEMLKDSPVHLYGGLALYKAGTDCDDGSWKNEKSILSKELEIIDKLKYQGVILYSWRYLNSPIDEILNLKNELTCKKSS